jgi:hypothetical protein
MTGDSLRLDVPAALEQFKRERTFARGDGGGRLQNTGSADSIGKRGGWCRMQLSKEIYQGEEKIAYDRNATKI